MTKQIKKIVNALKTLDLSAYPTESILEQFNSLSSLIPIIETKFYPRRIIIRGQLFNPDADYTMVSRHSYKPHNLTTEYQRANIPTKPMFYGAVTALTEKEDAPIARMTIMKEIGEIATNEKVLEETYIFSAWEVIEEIKLVTIIQNTGYERPSALVQKLQKQFKYTFRNTPGAEFMNYISSEFAKADTEDDFKYMISAWYSQIMCDFNYDGVIYPSVRMQGASMNIAIKPEAVDQKLKFISADKFIFKKEGMRITTLDHEYIL